MPDPSTPGAPADGSREATAPAAAQAGPQVHFTPPATALGAQDNEQRKKSSRPLMELREVSVFYGDFEAVRDTNLPIGQNRIIIDNNQLAFQPVLYGKIACHLFTLASGGAGFKHAARPRHANNGAALLGIGEMQGRARGLQQVHGNENPQTHVIFPALTCGNIRLANGLQG